MARAGLEELRLDYEDYLRQRGLRLWAKDSAEALKVRAGYLVDGSDKSDLSDPSDPLALKSASPEVAANTLLCLIHQASFLLGRQLRALEKAFLEEGGFTERLYRARSFRRKTA